MFAAALQRQFDDADGVARLFGGDGQRGFAPDGLLYIDKKILETAAFALHSGIDQQACLLGEEPVRTWVARAIVAIGVLLVGTLIGVVVNHFVRMSIFSGFDRLMGFLFGMLRGVVVLGVLAILGELLELDSAPWWKGSQLMPYASTTADVLRKIVGENVANTSG